MLDVLWLLTCWSMLLSVAVGTSWAVGKALDWLSVVSMDDQ
jgi:hypothetical protein